MATAKKLPSGSWRCLVFSHYENVVDKDGKPVIDPKQKSRSRKESMNHSPVIFRVSVESSQLKHRLHSSSQKRTGRNVLRTGL